LSAAEIRQGLALLGEIEPQNFYLFGKPISKSRSPALHNTLFGQVGLPHEYQRLETDKVEDVLEVLRSPDFGGASVTIPLKQDIMPHLDELTDAVKIIGAVNTIVPATEKSVDGRKRLTGDNTDWQGMVYVLRKAGVKTQSGSASAAVIGAGGTSRAAIFALHSLGFQPIYLVGRDAKKVESLASSFPAEYGVQPVASAADAEKLASRPVVSISTVPADKPLDSGVEETLGALFKSTTAAQGESRVLLEMAYNPPRTPVIQIAESAGNWTTISGLEVLAAQGWYQVCKPPL
jgi:pentafunctional AROM polypeptide